MTERVDFYVLGGTAPKDRQTFACRLAEKAYLKNLSVIILGGSAEEARALDELLWTFSDRSFVPHRCVDGEAAAAADAVAEPVRLTATLSAAGRADLLVNLSDRLPADLAPYTRIAEIIDADPERRRLGRERFKSYREHNLLLETHQLDGPASP